jgi:hypothetical protein
MPRNYPEERIQHLRKKFEMKKSITFAIKIEALVSTNTLVTIYRINGRNIQNTSKTNNFIFLCFARLDLPNDHLCWSVAKKCENIIDLKSERTELEFSVGRSKGQYQKYSSQTFDICRGFDLTPGK